MTTSVRAEAAYLAPRAAWALGGVALLALGSAVLLGAHVGVDPFTSANIGVSTRLGVGLGPYQLAVNAVLLVPVLVWGRRYVGLGTVINMVMVGFFVQWFSALLGPVLPDPPGLLLQGVLFLVGIVLFTAGASAYMTAGIGTAPYDAIAPIIVDRTGVRYRVIRVVQDLAFVGLAIAFGGPVGVGTVMTAFFAGPLIDFFTERVNKPLLHRLLPDGGAQEARPS
ncbi:MULTISPECIES: YczE/YyaS/YitT family protein [unclassified Isoptericola]|uniref:YczE/YyaS/YitT family protein n=1 Tax=unclassified Isoptericola TaxID=2623355 RepID=UPI0036639649